MKNTGVWTKVELDDEGNCAVKVHCAAEWMPGETVTVGEDVTDRIPADVLASLKTGLNKIIAASKTSLNDKARAAAAEMADFKLGKKKQQILQLNFSGETKMEGKVI